MIGLTNLEVYSSIFNVTEANNKFELYKFLDDKAGGVSFEKVRDQIERDSDISDTTASDLQDEIIGPINIKENREKVTKRKKDVRYMNILAGYPSSVFQVFESYLRTEIDLVENDNRLVLDKKNSSFITDELQPGICTFKDLSESVLNILQPKYKASINVIDIQFDNITRKTKLVVRGGIIAISFDEKSFFSTIVGFNHGWDYKHYNEYISQKILNLSSTIKIHLTCDVIDGSVVNGFRQPIITSFVSNKPSGYKVFCEPETIDYQKLKKSVFNTIKLYLEDDDHKEVHFNGKTLTFTLQLIKIY